MANRVRQMIGGYTPEQRADLGRLAAIGLLGLLLGLFIGWVVWPLEQTNAALDDLRPDLRAHYLAALADSYVAAGGQNPEITLARVGQLEDPVAALADAIRFYQANPGAASAVTEFNLRTLAAALGAEEAVIRSLQGEDAQPVEAINVDEPGIGWLPWLVVAFTALILVLGGLWIAYQLLRQRFEESQQRGDEGLAAADDLDGDAYDDSLRQTSEAEQMAVWSSLLGENTPPAATAPQPVNVNIAVQPSPSSQTSDAAPVVFETEVKVDTDDAQYANRPAANLWEDSEDFDDDEDLDEEEEEEDETAVDETTFDAAAGPGIGTYRAPSTETPSDLPDTEAGELKARSVDTPSDISEPGPVWVDDQPETRSAETPMDNPDRAARMAPPSEEGSSGESSAPSTQSIPPLPGPATASSLRRKPMPLAAKPTSPSADAHGGHSPNLQDRLSTLWRKESSERRDDVLERFTAHYQFGIADYDESFIITPQGELMGACGMGIDKELDPKAASSDKVHVLDVWFYDRTHLHTYNQLIVSRSMNWDNLTGKANNSGTVTGEPLVAAPGVAFKLHGKDLILDCRIESVQYLDEEDHHSPFRDVVVSLTVRKKK